jgi:hypothetical protein
MHSVLTGKIAAPRARQQDRSADDAVLRSAGELLLISLARTTQEAKERAEKETATAEAVRQEKVALEARLAEIERSHAAQVEAHQLAYGQVEQSLAHVRESAARMRAELIEKDAEGQRLREESVRAGEEYRTALERAQAAAASAEAAAKAANSGTPQVIYQPPEKPKKIDFQYHRGETGLLNRVVLKSEGYDDVVVDVVRGPDNRMMNLKVK